MEAQCGVLVIIKRKWTQQPKFESWTRLFAFHTALIHLGKYAFSHPPISYKLIVGQTDSLVLVWQLVWEKENSELKVIKLCLIIDLVSHPACMVEKCIYLHITDRNTQTPSLYIYIYIYKIILGPSREKSIFWNDLVWFYGISTIVDYLMPNLFLYI